MKKKKCLVRACGYETRTRGLCQMHYYRWKAGRLNVQPLSPMTNSESGRIGGRKGTTGGFASKEIGKDGLTGQQRASLVGVRGGSARRVKSA